MITARAIVLAIAFTLLAFAIVVSFTHAVRRVATADRVLGLDLLSNTGAGLMAVAAIAFDEQVFLDVSLILIVAGFVATASFAQLIEPRGKQ